MARVTSARDRSKGKTKKSVTTSKGRANRSSVSTASTTSSDSRPTNSGARVTNSSQRTNTGSARVTGTSRPSLPPGRQGGAATSGRGGALVKASNAKPADGRIYQVNAGEVRQRPKAISSSKPNSLPPSKPALPAGQRGGPLAKPPAKPSGNYRAPNLPKPSAPKPAASAAKAVAKGAARGAAASVGRVVNPLLAAAAVVDQARTVFNPKDNLLTSLQDLGRGVERATTGGGAGSRTVPTSRTGRGGTTADRVTPNTANSGRYTPGSQQVRFSAPPTKPSSAPSRPSSAPTSSAPSSRSSSSAPTRSAPAMPKAVVKASPAKPQAAPSKPASKGPNIGPTADGKTYGKALNLQSKIEGTADPDMKRRRAFLDAKDSLAGAKAVRELQDKRKKRLADLTK